MGKDKLKKFAKYKSFPFCYENLSFDQPQLIDSQNQAVSIAGQWKPTLGVALGDLILELACGKGEYTVGMAEHYPENGYIGVDIKGARMHQGACFVNDKKLSNAAFIRSRIELIEHFFSPGEVDGIFIIFPDPFLRNRSASRRLTSPPFLDRYRKICDPKATIRLKTDSPELYKYTLGVIQKQKLQIKYQIDDVYAGQCSLWGLQEIQTFYETMHLEAKRTIMYVEFNLFT
ncbi:MAG: tRNA (guanosine(46)-N7)-methyltransferase TrmB [Saprospirales bacterium]|nr:tRNA (guanosine(46)-N7)-methyltransferase TrmB [Saprospirales bacterium]|tara:strand:- start:6370 stop:7062 length:693 start_codon:yes stop_codon:yes gene_type:complete